MRTVTAKVNAYVTNDYTTIEELYQGEPANVVGALKFYLNESATPDSWVLAGTAEITLTLNDADNMITHKVASLRAALQKTQADAEVRCNVLREQINNLLALEYKP